MTSPGRPRAAQSVETLARAVRAGQVTAVAKACRQVDERGTGHEELLSLLYAHGRTAWLIGVTGTPGAGKSTLVDTLIDEFRRAKARVGVVAVDPTSPFSGGAILGDRIRMQKHYQDAEVFIRSVATRGALGGLSRTAADLARVMAAWGADVVLIETVGVGQDELDVMRVAHTTLVVQAPGAGDDVQAAKAGILECADVFVVNKADRPGAERLVQQLRAMLALGALSSSTAAPKVSSGSHASHWQGGEANVATDDADSAEASETWEVPVTTAVATRGQGAEQLVRLLQAHRRWLEATRAGKERSALRTREQFEMKVHQAIVDQAHARHGPRIRAAIDQALRAGSNPYVACRDIVDRVFESEGPED